MKEESITHESFSSSSIREEDFQDNSKVDDSKVVDTFDIVSDVSNSYCYDEIVVL
jgi:hypothetical protein